MRPRFPLAAAVAAAVAVLAAACGGDDAGLDDAQSCEELVEAAADVTRQVLADVAGLALDDLEAADTADPFASLLEPYAGFDERARDLGCGDAELTRLACDTYEEVVAGATGEVAEAFLAEYFAACD